ncbi:centrin-binding protein Sfi1 [Sugiyamaella lignohabitans]|uniref:Centrin-binding protein Sfi1 n=1 Tax=Sugiyamaella lignohabitans TaxID=796027 RepID=A0A167EUE4_9ASCO|nr:centrin-binding protein Sfi1 [Sugiyamaella lignohabitans]ANB14469.1 centrin-binding protein Sfi1 [Sugiyamaella lignohabitans]
MTSSHRANDDGSEIGQDAISTVDGLTYYDPGHLTSDEDPESFSNSVLRAAARRLSNVNTSAGDEEDQESEEDFDDGDVLQQMKSPIQANRDHQPILPAPPIPHDAIRKTKLTSSDVQLLRLVTEAADRRIRSNRSNSPIKDNGDSSLNEADFAELFQTYKVFTARNKITPENNPSYYHCLNVIVHLCSYPQETWRERLEQLLTDFSSAVTRRLRYQDLEQRLKKFQLYYQSRVLGLWYSRYVEQSMYDQNLQTVAAIRYRQTLKRDAFKVWKYNFEVEQWSLSSAELRYEKSLLRKSLAKLYNKSSSIEGDRNIAKMFILGKFLSKWSKSYHYNKQIGKSASLRYMSGLKRRIFYDWTFKFDEEMAEARANETIAIKCFNSWKNKTARFIQIGLKTEEQADARLAERAIRQWSNLLADRSNDYSLATSVYKKNLAGTVLAVWKKRTQLSLAAYPLLEKNWQSKASVVFGNWHLRTLQSLEAKRFRDFMLCHRILRSWRLQAGAVLIIKGIDVNIVKQRFHCWLLLERLELVLRYRNNSIKLKVLKHWFIRSRRSFRHNWALHKEAVSYDCARTQIKALFSWQRRLKSHRQDEQNAQGIYKQRKQKEYFSKYLAALFEYSQNYHLACKTYERSVVTRTLLEWRDEAYRRKFKRLAATYREQKRKFNHQRLKVVFVFWRSRYAEVVNDQQLALSMITQRDLLVKKSTFHGWASKIDHFESELDRAIYTYNANLLSLAIEKWRQKNTKIQQDNDMAGLRDMNQQWSLLGKVLRGWSYKVSERKRDYSLADDIYSKRQRSKFGRIWKLWHAKYSEQTLMRQFGQTNIGFTELEENKSPTARFKNPTQNIPHTIARIPQGASGSPDTRHFLTSITKPSTLFNTSLLETPTRARASGINVPLTAVEQWRKMKSSSKLRNKLSDSNESNEPNDPEMNLTDN